MSGSSNFDEIIQAKKQVVDGNFVLWRNRVETISEARGELAALDLIQAPIEPNAGNTNNNFGSGTCCEPARPSGTVTMGEPTITRVPPQ
ncbi:MAG: hypothetical protein QNJ33_13780 [Crocosphaera sp.]|nr:hypothetical protein [Crocosphaera sp.]